MTKYETIEEVVPQQRTEYLAQTHVEYIPDVTTEMVPLDRVQEKVQYKQVNKMVVDYPEFNRQFVEDGERSGKIITNPPELFGNQVIGNGPVQKLPQSNKLYASQTFARPRPVQQVQQSVVRGAPTVYQSQILQPSVVQDQHLVGVPVRSGLVASQVRPVITSPPIRNYPYTQPQLIEEYERNLKECNF